MKNRISSANDYAIANAAGRLPTSAVMSGRKIVPLGINFAGRSIFGPHSVPAAAVFPGFIRWPVVHGTVGTRQNSRGLRTNSSIRANLKQYKHTYKGESLPHLFRALSTEGR
jgi:hypothetical protein